MAAIGEEGRTPRAVIHKRILDVAEERPDASVASLADAVGGASVDLVERVLDEYGDPGVDAGSASADSGSPSEGPAGADPEEDPGQSPDEAAGADDVDDGEPPATEPTSRGGGAALAADGDAPLAPAAVEETPDASELTDRQLEVLRHVYDHPDASQRELGERLDVSASTVNKRLSGVPGFEWEDRWRFVRALFDRAPDGGLATTEEAAVTELRERVASLEERFDEAAVLGGAGDGSGPPLLPELAHKVVRACIESDRLDEEEELDVLRLLMGGELEG